MKATIRVSMMLAALMMFGCNDGNIQNGGAGPGGSTANDGTIMTGCLGDPDMPGACTFWTCSNVPVQFGKKIHCQGTHQGPDSPPGGGTYDCHAGTAAGEYCPPPAGGTSGGTTPGFHCVDSQGKITCDSGPACDAGSFSTPSGCATCAGAACALDVCAGQGMCATQGGTGGTTGGNGGCTANQYSVAGYCFECNRSSCNMPGCQTSDLCHPCGQGQFYNGTACEACSANACTTMGCATQPTCLGGPSGMGCQLTGCVPGAIRYCDGPTFCNWGIRTCQANGTWGTCKETNIQPPPGCGNARDSSFDEQCCIQANVCCEDFDGHPMGNCAATCK